MLHDINSRLTKYQYKALV